MEKVLTMTLNPCIDRTVYFDSFQVAKTNIVKKVMEEVAGKGINVAVGLQHLKVPVKALGFSYREDAYKLYDKLEKEGISYAFIEVDGRFRVNQKLFDESKSEMTECNEKGMSVSKDDIDKLFWLLQKELEEASILILSGSVPPGVEDTIYAVMISMANAAGVKVILDANGKLLEEGVKESPYLIKPNREEFRNTFGVNSFEESKIVANELLEQGVSYICLSLGSEGAVLFSKDDNGFVRIDKRPAIIGPIRSLQGAGDAMVAGIAKAVYENTEDKMLEYALHMAASTIRLEGTAMGELSND